MTITVAIDPGVRGCGLSVWDDDILMMAQYTSGTGGQANPLLEPIPQIDEIFRAVGRFDLLVIEIPEVYQTAHQKGDQQDLISLTFTAGAIANCASKYCSSVLPVLPKTWKGGKPKVGKDGTIIMERQMRRSLFPEELALIVLPRAKSLHHNVWDGVALGAWRLGRRPIDGKGDEF